MFLAEHTAHEQVVNLRLTVVPLAMLCPIMGLLQRDWPCVMCKFVCGVEPDELPAKPLVVSFLSVFCRVSVSFLLEMLISLMPSVHSSYDITYYLTWL